LAMQRRLVNASGPKTTGQPSQASSGSDSCLQDAYGRAPLAEAFGLIDERYHESYR
jgi:hypothetical protein